MEDVKEMSSPPAPGGYIGAVDDDRQGRLSGWAITREGDPCTVTLTVNDRAFTCESTQPRLDLAAKGQSRGQGGWRIDIGDALMPGENRVEIRLPDGTPLAGSPRTVVQAQAAPSATRYIGAVDTANGSLLSGWALTTTGEPCTLVVQVGNAPEITLVSHGTRADLAEKGMSNGGGGWHLFLDGHLSPGTNAITITLPDGAPLPGSPLRIEGPASAPPPAASQPMTAKTTQPTEAIAAKAAAPRRPVAVVTEKPAEPKPVADAAPTVRSAPAPERPRPTMPSLAELDELSLDDVALAVASGRVQVAEAEAPVPVPPVVLPATTTAGASPVEPRRGWLRRLLRR